MKSQLVNTAAGGPSPTLARQRDLQELRRRSARKGWGDSPQADRLLRQALLVLLALCSIGAWGYFYAHHLTTIYNDAMSHLDISRLVIDNLQPGLSQLGSVWLPLSHILYLPLIWNNWAWHSGFAGSIVSMISYFFAVIGIYLVTREIVDSRVASFVAAVVFALNVNVLYLQSTPLTEPLFLVEFVYACLFFIRYLKRGQDVNLILCAFFTSLQLLTRYDGWFVAVVETVILAAYELGIRKVSLKNTSGFLMLFVFPVVFTAFLWLLWNQLIFSNPLYFLTGPYSAHAQQQSIQTNSGLITQHNWVEAAKAYGFDIVDNIGITIVVGAAIGWVYYLWTNVAAFSRRVMVALTLSSVIVFNIVALYLGFSILNVPQLHWNPSGTPAGDLFNARYGILALPFCAIGLGFLSKKRIVAAAVVALVVVQGVMLWRAVPITILDGTVGSSSFADGDIAVQLKADVGANQKVLLSTSYFNAVMFESGLPLKQFIQEGVSKEWKPALANPDTHAQWVVMANGNIGEPVYTSLVVDHKDAFLADYTLAYKGEHANIYEKKSTDGLFVHATGSALAVNTTPYAVRGVNSYDLAYRTDGQIDQTFKDLQQAHVNTVRFWLFGDGTSDGFQPTPGALNPARLATTDYIIADAKNYNIRLIPTLSNYWGDYGGVSQYLAWAGLPHINVNMNSTSPVTDAFYTSAKTQTLYQNYVHAVLTRKNPITGLTYAGDPTILAWDLMNEPEVASNDRSELVAWVKTMSAYVHSLDANHLVTVGLDGHAMSVVGGSVCSVPEIGFCSVHFYIDDNGRVVYPSLADASAVLKGYKTAAGKKPVVATEIGISKTLKPFGQSPLSVLGDFETQMQQDGYQGWLIWNWSLTPDTSYGFSPSGLNGQYTAQQLGGLLNR